MFPIRYADTQSGKIANPDAGWPDAPPALQSAPSIAAQEEQDALEAQVEKRVEERIKERERARAKKAAAARR